MTDTKNKLNAARKAGEMAELPPFLIAHANALLEKGKFEEARALLDEAAGIHADLNRNDDQARCLQLSASASRFAGDLQGSMSRALRATEVAKKGTPTMVSAFMEMGETAQALGDSKRAIIHYENALKHGVSAGMLPQYQAKLMRRQAQAQAEVELFAMAALTLRKAHQAAKLADDEPQALRILIEEATAWLESALPENALPALKEAETGAMQQENKAILTDLFLLRSMICLREKSLDHALENALKAREFALQATQPISYVSAAFAISDLSEQLGDKVAAYGSLAVGMVTLGDVMGEQTAKVTFEPKLQRLLERWGRDEFVKTRDAFVQSQGQRPS